MGHRYPPISNMKELLEDLRNIPANSNAVGDEVLAAMHEHLLEKHPHPTGDVHWFCEKADSLTKEVAAFSLRLFAYNGGRVDQWKTVLQDCISCCAHCGAAFENGKIIWQKTYVFSSSQRLYRCPLTTYISL